jgi:hypothetical protein
MQEEFRRNPRIADLREVLVRIEVVPLKEFCKPGSDPGNGLQPTRMLLSVGMLHDITQAEHSVEVKTEQP